MAARGLARRWRAGVTLACLVAFALAVHLQGLRRDLPFLPEVDEADQVLPALRIASGGDLNPRWFEHPGSTMIYPLAALGHVWNAAAHGGPLWRRDAELQRRFLEGAARGEGHLLGRVLSVAYAVLCVPLVFLLGRRTFGAPAGLLAAALVWLSPVAIDHAQMVRGDSAAAFFAVLALWCCCRLYDRARVRDQLLAGVAIGLGVATRYFLVTLVPVLVVLDLVLRRREPRPRGGRVAAAVAGLAAAGGAFALSTPYLVLDRETVWRDLAKQSRTSHPGADGLSFAGNLLWYLTDGIPAVLPAPLALLALGGAVAVVRRRRPKELLLLFFAVTFLAGISRSALHWARWIIPLGPVLALFAAALVVLAGGDLLRRRVAGRRARLAIAGGALALLVAWPAVRVGRYVRASFAPSTLLAGRAWIVANLPSGARIAAESYTPPLGDTSFVVERRFFALPWGGPLATYRRGGYRYVLVSSAIYDRFLREPARYRGEAAFYQELFRDGRLVKEFLPSATSRGPTIRLYELAP